MSNSGFFAAVGNLSQVTINTTGAGQLITTNLAKENRYGVNGESIDDIVIDFSASTTMDTVLLLGLNAFPTIDCQLKDGGAYASEEIIDGTIYGAEPFARQTYNVLFKFASGGHDGINLLLSGSLPTSIASIFVGSSIFEDDGFEYGSSYDDTPEFKETDTGSARYLVGSAEHYRAHSLNYPRLSDAGVAKMNHMKRVVGKNNCLFMQDVYDTHPEKWYIATLRGASQNLRYLNINDQTLHPKEAFRWY